MSRATSPFIVKVASFVDNHHHGNEHHGNEQCNHGNEQCWNHGNHAKDPTVKNFVKSVVMFNDVEYQVPTKVRTYISHTVSSYYYISDCGLCLSDCCSI